MKEKIYENFGYKVKYLFYRKEYISFQYENQHYLIQNVETTEEKIEKLDNLIYFFEQHNIFFHKFVKTLNNSYTFEYNHKKYVLFHIRIFNDRSITIDDVINLSNIKINRDIYDFVNPGIRIANKIDELEKYFANYENEYYDLLIDFNYFVGLAENAIMLYNSVDTKQLNLTLSHKRLEQDKKTISFYNPLELTIDFQTRDLAEYVKEMFFNEKIDKLSYYIQYMGQEDFVLYFARLMYPSFYFDIVDSIISKTTSNYDLNVIRSRINDYEIALKKTYYQIRQYVPIIEWLGNINDF